MKIKKVLVILLSISMIITLSACNGGNSSGNGGENGDVGSGDATYSWKAANVLAAGGAWDQGLQEFARLLDEKSGGRIELTIYNGGQLGGERDTIEGLQMGTVDFVICSSATLANFTDTNNIWDLPFLFQSTEAARAVMDSDIAGECLDTLSDVGIKGLSYWENGMYVIGATKEVRTPADMQGLRVRTIESNLQSDVYSVFGATAVVIPWGDVYTSLQQGLCDVTTTTAPNMYSAKQHEVAKYVTEAGQTYGPAPILMAQSLWNSLPEDIQTIVQEAADEAKLIQRQAVDDDLVESRALMEADGCTFIEIDKAEWAALVEPLYDKYVGTMGIEAEMVKAVRAMAEQYY